MADDDELGTMIGRFRRAEEVNGAIHAYTQAHTADEVVAACVDARVPAAIVGNGAELPRNEQLAARDVFVRQPGESWIRPRAPFRFHGVADRALAAPGDGDQAGVAATRRAAPSRPPRRATGRSPGMRVLDFTAFWAGPFATAWLSSMGADVVKVEAVQRPDGIRFSAAVRPHDDALFYEKSALFHACNLAKRGITLDLGHPDGLAIAKRLVERSDVVAENFTPAGARTLRARLGHRARAEPGRDHAAHARVRPRRAVARPWRVRADDGTAHRHGVGHGLRGRPADHPRGPVDPMVGAHAALAVVAALEHRARTGEGQLVEVPLVEVATAVTAEQVIRYAIDGTLLDRRGAGGVYRCAGDDAWVAIDRDRDPMAPEARAQWCATRTPDDAARDALAQGVPAAAMVPGYATLDDPQMRRAASSNRSTTRWSASSTTRRGRCGCRRSRAGAGPRPRRPSASTTSRCCATSSASTTTSSPASRPST